MCDPREAQLCMFELALFFDLDRICFSARSCFFVFFFVGFFSAPPGLLPAKTKTRREELKRERHGERVIERDAQ